MSNWIKPEKCKRPIMNLGQFAAIIEGVCNARFPFAINFSMNDAAAASWLWAYELKEDRDHDYQRVLEKLGLR